MSFNSVQTDNIIRIINQIDQRVANLSAKLQGVPIDSLRIGDAIITGAQIGNLAITTAMIEDGAITDAKISSLSASSINAGTLSADRIATDTITATMLNVSTLSSITANLGTVTAGSITGLTITASLFRTSSGNDRVAVDSSNKLLFYEGGALRNWIREDLFYIFRGTGSGSSGIGFNTSSGGSGGVMGLSSDENTVVYGVTNNPLVLFQNTSSDGYDGVDVARVIGEDDNTDIYINCANFKINGSTKTAIVPTSSGYRALYCVESPEVWFYDIVKADKIIDNLFLAVTEGDTKTITNENGDRLVFRKRKGMSDVRFDEKTQKQYFANEKRWQF